ncbi:MAG: hypothetical protein ACETVT_03900 [bacterium]
MFNEIKLQFKREDGLKYKYAFSKSEFFALLFFLVVANLFTINFINRENYIYFWDCIHYWAKYVEISDLFRINPLGTIRNVIHSIRYMEYNKIAPFLLMPFGFLFGKERMPYILSIVNIFAFPSVISFVLLYKRVVGKIHDDLPVAVSFIAVFTMLTFPFFWTPILYGYVGVGGFFVINLILLTYLKQPFSKQSTGNVLYLGLLIPVLVLFRRWYAYWAVSFYIALAFNVLILSFPKHHSETKRYLVSLLKVLLVVLVSAMFFMIATPVAIKIIKTDYADIYSAYRFSTTIFQSFGRFFGHFGLFYVVMFLLGSVYALSCPKIRRFSLLLLPQWIIIFLLFSRTLDFGFHHYYLLQPTMLLFISLYVANILLKTKTKTGKIIICSAYVLISLLNFSAVFIPKASRYTRLFKHVFPGIRHYPLVRNDIDEIKRLLNVLKDLLSDPGDRVYVLSSSGILNSSILHDSYLSLLGDRRMHSQILNTHDVDKRDGFPSEFLTARYVVVAYPIQYHLRPEDQRVVGTLAEFIMDGGNIGTSYKQLPYEFVLDKGVRVYIYEKVRPFKKTDIDLLSELFRKHYPDREYLYEITVD